MYQERGLDQFHDSELGDIYDLFNACNGTMSGGLLDVRKLDELTPREREALDLGRLRQVWEHTAAGCVTCARIVRTLNTARGMTRRQADDPPRSEPPSSPADAPGRAKQKAKALGQSR